MNRLKYVLFATMAIALMAVVAMAQAPGAAPAGDNASTVLAAKAIGGGIGFGLAAGLAGIGQGLEVHVPPRAPPATQVQPVPSRR